RTKPFDVNNSDDLKEMLNIRVCALLDYVEYETILDDLLERFDESIEYYDASTWLSFTTEISEPDKLLQKCYVDTRRASDSFQELTDKAANECAEALRIVLNSHVEMQNKVLGFNINGITDVENRLNNAFEEIYDVVNSHKMNEAYNNFVEFIKERLFGDPEE
ncbi:MAG: hypothetical protein PHU23_15265, partial [Dehalococcoidales bacterium]|nr:hypothetical protein [Dehalococcoidales bacterium]